MTEENMRAKLVRESQIYGKKKNGRERKKQRKKRKKTERQEESEREREVGWEKEQDRKIA